MYYSAIGVLAAIILLIENQDILLNRNGAFDKPAWRVYRRFLFSILAYYITDIYWGILESQKLARLLFADTTVYYVAMAAGLVLWTQYIVTYLEEKSAFSRFCLYAGRGLAATVTALAIVNCFFPVLFSVDGDSVYHPFFIRYVLLACQILLLILISGYAFSSISRRHRAGGKGQRYRTLALFGVSMAVCLLAQLWFPYLPLYAIAYLMGTCLLRAFVIGDEKEMYRHELEEAAKIRELKRSISSLLDNMPGLSFSKDAETGVYLACNQAFAEYAHKAGPEGVVGLTDAQIFDPVTASHFVEDDRMALSMDGPYIFFEDVPDAAGNQRQFQTTKLKFIDDVGRLCTLGLCQDVTELVRVQREHATTKEAYENARSAGIIYTHIAQTLASGYTDLFYVNLDTGEFIEYTTDDASGTLEEKRRGDGFFDECKVEAEIYVHPDDRAAFVRAMDKRALQDALDRNRNFIMAYRLLTGDGGSTYVTMRVSRMVDDARFIIIGVTDTDEQMKQQRAIERAKEERIAYARLNALTGDFLGVYIVVPETGRYREYSITAGFETAAIPKAGMDYFTAAREQARKVVHPEDLPRVLSLLTREGVLSEVERSGIFSLTYRIIPDGRPIYVQLRAAMVDEKEGRRLVVGINDIDASMRQEEEYARRLAQAQTKANVDALTGIKNKHAYLDAEDRLNRQIAEGGRPQFAVTILDVNDLKRVNDTGGHQAGDQYLRDACRIVCTIFKQSPVFRIGGDEFAVISQGSDYARIDELLEAVSAHNAEAIRAGGIVVACGMSKYENDASVAPVFERADLRMYENKSALKSEGGFAAEPSRNLPV